MSAKDRPRPEVDDEVKARYRAALDAKRSRGGADGTHEAEHGKVDHAHRAETSARQQMFRRKSG